MKRLLFVATIFFFVSNYTLAQDSLTMAKSAMLNAETYYGKNEFSDAWGFTDQAIKYLGKTNSKVQYLRVKICLAKASNDNSKWGVADKEMKSFFAVTKEGEYNEEKYNEMLESIAFIEKNITEYKWQTKREEKAFKKCLNENTLAGYKDYLNNYPKEGLHYFKVQKLKELNEELLTSKSLRDITNIHLKISAYLGNNNCPLKSNEEAQLALACHLADYRFSSITSRKVRKLLESIFNTTKNRNLSAKEIELILEDKDVKAEVFNNTNGINVLLRCAIAEYEFEQYKDAAETVSYILSMDAKNIKVISLKASIYLSQLTFDSAIAMYNKILELNNTDSTNWVYNNRATCKERMNDLIGAEEDYAKYISKIDSKYKYTNIFAYNNRARVRTKLKKYSLAIEDYNYSISKDDEDALYLRSKIYLFNIRDTIKANEGFKAYLQKDNQDYSTTAFCHYFLGNVDKAIAIFKTNLSEIEPDDSSSLASLYYDYARLLSLMNNKAEALDKLKLSFDYGSTSFVNVQQDEDFKNIYENTEFLKLIESAKKNYLLKYLIK